MKKLIVAVVVLCLFSNIHILAQGSNATVGGTVSDASGALIPGVSITARNLGTGIVSTTITNEAGAYQFASLQTGAYTLSAELSGFRTQTYNDVALGVSQTIRLNFTMPIGGVATEVQVTAAVDTLLATSTVSVGAVLPEYKVRDLPLMLGSVMELIGTTPGAVRIGNNEGYFAGGRQSSANVTRDGINVNDGRYEFGAYSMVFQSPDMVEEVRVIVGPADAETSRGSGQVQLATRSGTNQFRGSVFWANQNSMTSANSWFNNFNGAGKDFYNRNEYGARLGGPIIRNKTFFFGYYNGQRAVMKESFTGVVLTEQARQGIFRYFPGADNRNAQQNSPTVDRLGNPVRPAGATEDLRSFSVFGRDPLRATFDTSTFGRAQLARMPLPNDFTVGDGLNTAGIRFVRRLEALDIGTGFGNELDRDQYNLRLDHSFNANHQLSVVGTREKDRSFLAQAGIRSWPTGFDALSVKRPDVYTINLVSTLSSSLVNQLTLGRRRSIHFTWPSAQRPDDVGNEAFSYIPQANGIPFRPVPILTPPFVSIGGFANYRDTRNPMHIVGDSVSWTRGQHAFKTGAEFRFLETFAANNPDVIPRIVLGAGAQAVTGIDATAFPGLTGANATVARNLLLDLSGSVGSVNQAFGVKNAQDLNFYSYPDIPSNEQHMFQNEFSGYFKDDLKLRTNLTVNLGIHWEWYGAVYEKFGRAGYPVGGPKAFECGYSCGLVSVEFVGKNSAQPDKSVNKDDWNNWAPNIGVSWNLPWWGQDKTVLRAGYGVSYTGPIRHFPTVGGVLRMPGSYLGSAGAGVAVTPATYTTLSTVTLPITRPLTTALQPIPLTDRTQTPEVYDYVLPYIQNFNLEIQREIARNTTVEMRYVGNKGTKLLGVINLNTVDIFNNGILAAFNQTRAGEDARLFDDMLTGINLGNGVVNGSTLTGSAALRTNTTTRAMLANGNVGALANFLNTSNTGTSANGGLLRRNGFPEDFIVLNPQFANVNLRGNPGNSTYHSMQLQLTKRLSNGFTNSTAYVWSRTLGEADGDGGTAYRDPRNQSLNKSLLGFHRTHALTSNGTFELPFGPDRALLNSAPGWISRLVEGWQLGGIFSWSSGQPLTISTGLTTMHQSNAGSTPNIVGAFPTSMGDVQKVADGVVYFDGLQLITDPYESNITSLNGLRGQFSNKAITDAQGNLLLVNPEPGKLGTLGLTTIEGPSSIGLDMNLIKRVRIGETREFEIRMNAMNVLNTPVFANPDTNINSAGFGRITSTATGWSPRRFVTTLRLNF